MSKSKIWSEAIADAKALKETALQNAKISLAETFSPRIESMLSQQLNEMEEELDENLEENSEATLEEVLDSLDENENLHEEEEMEEPIGDELGGDEMDSEFEGEFEDEIEGEVGGDEEVGEITVDELKDIMRDVMMELDGGEEILGDDTLDVAPEMEEEELEITEGSEPDVAAAAGLENILNTIKKMAAKSPQAAAKIKKVLADLGAGAGAALRSESNGLKELVKENKELKEANKILKTTLKEVNLINSKLLHLNKIFKARNLTENQKLKVINTFDKADTIKETETIYSVLKESLSSYNKKTIKENRSFASSPNGNGLRNLNESRNPQVEAIKSRMQKLAGIK